MVEGSLTRTQKCTIGKGVRRKPHRQEPSMRAAPRHVDRHEEVAMLFRSYKPAAPLCDFVEDCWLYQNYAGEHARERILPSGTFEMVFNLNEDELRIYGMHEQDECRRYAGAVISGPYARSFTSDAAEETSIMGVHFKPGG